MNKKTEKILIIGTVALLVLAVVVGIGLLNGGTMSANAVAADSVLSNGGGCVFYNNTNNDIIKKVIYSGETTVFAENLTLMSSSDNEVLASDGNNFIIMNFNGEEVDRIEGIVVLAAQITDDYIYYKHIDSRFVVQLERATGNVKDILPIAVDKFEVHGNQVVFTVDDKKMIYFYDMTTGIPMGYFGDKSIADFEFADNWIIYSDLKDGGKVTKMNVSDGSEEELKGVKTAKFTYKDGNVYYVENAGKNKKAYELKEYTGNKE